MNVEGSLIDIKGWDAERVLREAGVSDEKIEEMSEFRKYNAASVFVGIELLRRAKYGEVHRYKELTDEELEALLNELNRKKEAVRYPGFSTAYDLLKKEGWDAGERV